MFNNSFSKFTAQYNFFITQCIYQTYLYYFFVFYLSIYRSNALSLGIFFNYKRTICRINSFYAIDVLSIISYFSSTVTENPRSTLHIRNNVPISRKFVIPFAMPNTSAPTSIFRETVTST